jgi:hypothetical protein
LRDEGSRRARREAAAAKERSFCPERPLRAPRRKHCEAILSIEWATEGRSFFIAGSEQNLRFNLACRQAIENLRQRRRLTPKFPPAGVIILGSLAVPRAAELHFV